MGISYFMTFFFKQMQKQKGEELSVVSTVSPEIEWDSEKDRNSIDHPEEGPERIQIILSHTA